MDEAERLLLILPLDPGTQFIKVDYDNAVLIATVKVAKEQADILNCNNKN